MRRFLLALMVVLLPLRGLAGDVMATQMQALGSVGDAIETIATTVNGDRVHGHNGLRTPATAASQRTVAGSSSCAGSPSNPDDTSAHPALHTPGAGDKAGSNGQQPNNCGTCPTCQICHSVALAVPSGAGLGADTRHAAPCIRGERFSSFTPAPGLKPPIA